ncbi:MAG TPA: cysteine hydrolase [Actinobacteria bacterium]|nr:cysteine hydrolase [Actinomycetota bacterium]
MTTPFPTVRSCTSTDRRVNPRSCSPSMSDTTRCTAVPVPTRPEPAPLDGSGATCEILLGLANRRSVWCRVSKRALVLIEFQEQWTRQGLYHRLVKRQLDTRHVVATARRVTEVARLEGVVVIHAPLVIDPEDKRGALAHLTFGRVFTKGTPRAEFTAGIFEEGDLVVRGRTGFDAFAGTDLAQLLRENGIDKVFFGGLTTDQCVARTLRTALRMGLRAYLVPEITATFSGWLQRRAEKRFAEYLAPLQEAGGPFPGALREEPKTD